jgi:hypothetical protein
LRGGDNVFSLFLSGEELFDLLFEIYDSFRIGAILDSFETGKMLDSFRPGEIFESLRAGDTFD